ncbi:MAG TPA: hypothetical protein VMB71_15130, partial [Acetobacteraceae bacterium]|nr:hypothetical protein [Acetobacteraceae bacterium]
AISKDSSIATHNGFAFSITDLALAFLSAVCCGSAQAYRSPENVSVLTVNIAPLKLGHVNFFLRG